MRKRFLISFFLCFCVLAGAQDKIGGRVNGYVIGFYNMENLFDTKDDPHVNDNDYLPDGKYGWTEDQYNAKLGNLASVIRAMATENGRWHTLLGVAEAENLGVLEDLVVRPEIAKAGYKIVHYDSPDPRGIDVALLYNPAEFRVLDSEQIPFTKENGESFRTRDILMVHGKLAGEQMAVYVAHLPSRIGGKGADNRSRGADIIYEHSRRMEQKYPGIKIVVMGDMNDDPVDESQAVHLHAKETVAQTGREDFFSPFTVMLLDGFGTLEYRGIWNIFDLIHVNYNLAVAPDGGLHIARQGDYYGRVFKKDFLIQQSGRYKGTPFRSFSGGKFINGYSDHLPTYIVINKSR